MRRSDREVKDFDGIIRIMEKCDVCRIALNNNGYPYILPLNFGMKVDIVKQKYFDQMLSASLNNEEKTVQVSSLLSYRNNEGKSRHAIRNDNSFTIKALYRLGFSWPITGQIYIQKFLQALEMLGFFDE